MADQPCAHLEAITTVTHAKRRECVVDGIDHGRGRADREPGRRDPTIPDNP